MISGKFSVPPDQIEGDVKKIVDAGEMEIGRIVGHIESEGKVTLDECSYITKSGLFGSLDKSIIRVRYAFLGISCSTDEEAVFDSIVFSIEGLDEWIRKTGIQVKHSISFNSNNTATINYEQQPTTRYKLSNGYTLAVFYKYTVSGGAIVNEAKITAKSYLKLSKDDKTTLDEYLEVVHKIVYLICLATGKMVTLTSVVGKSRKNSEESIIPGFPPNKVKIYYPSQPFSKVKPEIAPHEILFSYRGISNKFDAFMGKWIDSFSLFGPALYLYFSSVGEGQKFLDGKFLAMVQAMEVFHRRTSDETLMREVEYEDLVKQILDGCPEERKDWLADKLKFGNELTLRKRVKKIIQPFEELIGSNKEIKRLVSDIVNTRNYLTHYNDKRKEESVSGSSMLRVWCQMQVIFLLNLLMYLEFDISDIKKMLRDNYSLSNKLTGQVE